MTDLAVSEVFGPTLQGEGPYAGHPAVFLRLARCNLSCTYCDTPFTWDWQGRNGVRFDPVKEVRKMKAKDVAVEVAKLGTPDRHLLVVTGGEPLLQQAALDDVLSHLKGWTVQVETNGTRAPEPWLSAGVETFVVSPHLANAGTHQQGVIPEVLEAFSHGGNAVFKFVVSSMSDVAAVVEVEDACGLYGKVWVMPEGRTPLAIEQGLRWLAPIAVERGWRLSGRLHVTVWGDKRGR